jgi:hypothetical protein
MLSASPIAFLPSTDLDRSRQFFADRLGLTIEEVTPFACVVRVGTAMLRVTKADQLRARRSPCLAGRFWTLTPVADSRKLMA